VRAVKHRRETILMMHLTGMPCAHIAHPCEQSKRLIRCREPIVAGGEIAVSLSMRAALALQESRAARMKHLEALAAALALQSENWELRCEIREASQRFLDLVTPALVNRPPQGPATP
jgi:hypothetical protein